MEALLAVALIPVALCMRSIYRADIHEPEPRALVLAVMLGGVLTAFPAGVCEVLFSKLVLDGGRGATRLELAVSAFLGVALFEEGLKRWVVMRKIYRHPEFDEPFDGIVYAVASSLGFAGIENVLYVLGGGFGVGVARALTSIPGHTMFGIAMGYCLGHARFAPSPEAERRWLQASLLVPVALHGLYDYFLFVGEPHLTLGVLACMLFLSHQVIRQMQASAALRAQPRGTLQATAETWSATTPRGCAGCGGALVPGARFCSHCGLATFTAGT